MSIDQKNSWLRAFLGKLAPSIVNALVLISALLIFAETLLGGWEGYFFRVYTLYVIVFGSILYGIAVFVALCLIPVSRKFSVFSLVLFSVVFLFLEYQIAYDSRAEFGVTWLPSEVLWELVVYKAKGIYILVLALVVRVLCFHFLSKTKRWFQGGDYP